MALLCFLQMPFYDISFSKNTLVFGHASSFELRLHQFLRIFVNDELLKPVLTLFGREFQLSTIRSLEHNVYASMSASKVESKTEKLDIELLPKNKEDSNKFQFSNTSVRRHMQS